MAEKEARRDIPGRDDAVGKRESQPGGRRAAHLPSAEHEVGVRRAGANPGGARLDVGAEPVPRGDAGDFRGQRPPFVEHPPRRPHGVGVGVARADAGEERALLNGPSLGCHERPGVRIEQREVGAPRVGGEERGHVGLGPPVFDEREPLAPVSGAESPHAVAVVLPLLDTPQGGVHPEHRGRALAG